MTNQPQMRLDTPQTDIVLGKKHFKEPMLRVQMATGTPPLAELHPMRALFLIPKDPAPRLEGSFSQPLRDFVARCLHKVKDSIPELPTIEQIDISIIRP